MKSLSPKRNIAIILLISLLLQSCGVEVPIVQLQQGKPIGVRGGPVVESTEGSSGTPEMQMQSAPVTATSSPAGSPIHPFSQPGFQDLSPQQLHQYVSQSPITSTRQLVAIYNNPPNLEQAHMLHEWIRAHVGWISDRKIDTLDEDQVLEYACLAEIDPSSAERHQLLYRYFVSLSRKIEQNNIGEQHLIQALETTLRHIEPQVFESRTDELISIGKCLLHKIRPANTTFSKNNYPKHGAILTTLHTILLLIRQLDATGWSDREGGLYQDFQEKLLAIQAASAGRYYPVTYYSHLLSKSLEALRVSDSQLDAKVWQGIKAFARCYEVSRKLIIEGEVDVDAIEKTVKELTQTYRNVCESMGCRWLVDKLRSTKERLTWYEHLSKLSEAGLLVLGDSYSWAQFRDQIKEVQQEASILQRAYPEGCKALQYGIVSQLTMLALHKSTRSASIEQLKSLTELSLWNTDQDVIEATFEGLLTVAKQEQRENSRKQASFTALGYLSDFERQVYAFQQSEEAYHTSKQGTQAQSAKTSTSSWICCFASRHGTTTPRSVEPEPDALVKAMRSWLGKEKVADRLSRYMPPHQAPVPNRLFKEVQSDLKVKLHQKIQAEPPPVLPAAEMQALLRSHYQAPHFKELPSFLGEAPMSVEIIECHLKLNEQKKIEDKEGQDQFAQREERLQWVKTPIEFKDLFKKRSLKPKEPEKDINKVLLVGEAGTGKTSLTRKLAHDWT
ncbi:MAG: hypothetical protein AAFU83_00380, partial [Bacteroidota bacterium]